MRQVLLEYTDFQGYKGSREARYTCGPYTPDRAARMQDGLTYLGCKDFKMVPYRPT